MKLFYTKQMKRRTENKLKNKKIHLTHKENFNKLNAQLNQYLETTNFKIIQHKDLQNFYIHVSTVV